MSSTPLINVDCQWLDELGQTFLDDGDLQTGMKLRQVAARFQALDQRLLTLSSDGAYVAGRQSVYQELAARSNIPDAVHSPRVKRTSVDESKVRKMPAHTTTAQLQAKEIADKLNAKKREATNERLAPLAGLKLNLNLEALGKK